MCIQTIIIIIKTIISIAKLPNLLFSTHSFPWSFKPQFSSVVQFNNARFPQAGYARREVGGRGALEHWAFQEAKMRECRPFIPLILQTPVQFNCSSQQSTISPLKRHEADRSESAIGDSPAPIHPLDLTNPSSVQLFNSTIYDLPP